MKHKKSLQAQVQDNHMFGCYRFEFRFSVSYDICVIPSLIVEALITPIPTVPTLVIPIEIDSFPFIFTAPVAQLKCGMYFVNFGLHEDKIKAIQTFLKTKKLNCPNISDNLIIFKFEWATREPDKHFFTYHNSMRYFQLFHQLKDVKIA
jgi:hypothetical protein